MGRHKLRLLPLLAVALAACSSSTEPEPEAKALGPGTYSVSFNVPSLTAPGALTGDHEFTFRVIDPVSEQASFTLLSSVHTSRTIGGDIGTITHDYLDPDPRSIISTTTQWRLQWWYRSISSLAVRVNVNEGENGELELPLECSGAKNEIENFPGFGCVVTRVE